MTLYRLIVQRNSSYNYGIFHFSSIEIAKIVVANFCSTFADCIRRKWQNFVWTLSFPIRTHRERIYIPVTRLHVSQYSSRCDCFMDVNEEHMVARGLVIQASNDRSYTLVPLIRHPSSPCSQPSAPTTGSLCIRCKQCTPITIQ